MPTGSPTVFLDVRDRLFNQIGIVVKGAQSRIAVKTKHASDPSGLVIVVHLCGRPLAADRAHAILGIDQRLNLCCSYPVSALQVIVAFAPVQTLFAFANLRVVATFAVKVIAVGTVSISWKVGTRLAFTALATSLRYVRRCMGQLFFSKPPASLWASPWPYVRFVSLTPFLDICPHKLLRIGL
jgi:hypothetical protein